MRERYWHWSTCGGRTFRLQHEEKCLSNCRPPDYQPGDEHMCGLLRYSLYGTRDAAQNWEEELASTLSGLGLTRGSAYPCVWRGRIKGEDITIGGQRSAVESLIKMISKKYEMKKQVLGGECSTASLNGIVTASLMRQNQRHVKEIMKGVELERSLATLRLHVMWKGEMKTRGRTDADEDKPSTGGMT